MKFARILVNFELIIELFFLGEIVGFHLAELLRVVKYHFQFSRQFLAVAQRFLHVEKFIVYMEEVLLLTMAFGSHWSRVIVDTV